MKEAALVEMAALVRKEALASPLVQDQELSSFHDSWKICK